MSTLTRESRPWFKPSLLHRGPSVHFSRTHNSPVRLDSLSPKTSEEEVRVSPGAQPYSPAWALEGGLCGLAGEACPFSSHSELG